MKTIIAIDPGASGGISVGYPNGSTVAHKMPETEGDILALLTELVCYATLEGSEILAVIELVPIGMPGKGAAMAKLNSNAAFIRGCLMALHIRMILIRPVEWQSYFNLGKRSGCVSDSQWKNKLKSEAQRRFPQLKVTLDTADSLLILEHAKQNMTNQTP